MTQRTITGLKKKMTQIFMEDGTMVPVTSVALDREQDFGLLIEGVSVVVSGVSKGKGFAGGVKRHGFAGGPKTHGQSDRHRAIGSIGAGTDPGKVWKGKKMPGRMGGDKITVKGLKVIRFVPDQRMVFISGAIPGSINNKVTIYVESEGGQNE